MQERSRDRVAMEPGTRAVTLRIGAGAAFVAVAATVAMTAGDLGLTWDEVPYRASQVKMAAWFEQLIRCRSLGEARPLVSKQALLRAWEYNRYGPNFHPPLAGMVDNLSHALFGWFLDDLASRRMGSGLLLAGSAAVLLLFLGRRYGIWTGGVAAASLVLMPRVFGHAQIAGTDLPLMAFWAFVALAFWNGLASWWWRVAFGVLLGLAFLVKFSAVLVVLPIGLWLLLYRALPGLTWRQIGAFVLGTAFVGWPLGLAGAEVVRLAERLKLATLEGMVGSAAEQVLGQPLHQLLGHVGPYNERELRQAAAMVRARLPAQRPASMAPQQWQSLQDRLEPDNHIRFVQVRQLPVKARYPGWLLLVPLPLWLLWSCWRAAGRRAGQPGQASRPAAGLQLWLTGLAVAPAVAVACNPTWWHETLAQLAHYYQISVGRQGALPDIEIFYLGHKYIYSLPWHNGWVLIGVTVPTALLLLGLLGAAASLWQGGRDPLRSYFLLHLVTFPAIRMLPTPAHDGVRLMLPAFFFLAAMAGWGFGLLYRLLYRWRADEASVVPLLSVAATMLLLPPFGWLTRTHPHELSYYNGLVGGLSGAQRLGFEPTYWYDAVTPQVLAVLNDPRRGLPPGAVLGLPDPKINPEVFIQLQRDGKLRPDIRFDAAAADDFAFIPLLTHSSKATPFTRLMYALRPKLSWRYEGVRLFSLYEPAAVARAWALWLLLDDSDRSVTPLRPRVDRRVVELARSHYRAVYAAAVRVTEQGLEAALTASGEPTTRAILDRLAARRRALEFLLARRKTALIEAAEIVCRVAADRPELLARIIEYEGYLPDEQIGNYLDAESPGP